MKRTCSWSFPLPVAAAALLTFLVGGSARADYASAVLGDGPLTYHRFSEASVVTMPYPLATNIGTLGAVANAPDYTTAPPDPAIGKGLPGALADANNTAFRFPGKNATAVVVPYNAELAPSGPFTVEFWAKPATTDFSCPTAFFQYVSPRSGWLIYQSDATMDYGNGWMFRLYNGVNTSLVGDAQVAMPINTNLWYHIVAVWDGSYARIYTNGVLAASAAKTGSYPYAGAPSTRALTIGTRGNSGSLATYEYAGLIDEYAFYGSALSADTVAAHFAAATTNATGYATQILGSSPAGYWRFNELFNPTVVSNLGTGGSAFDGTYRNYSTTAPDLQSPAFAGMDAANRVLLLNTNTPGYVQIPPLNKTNNTTTIECWLKRNGTQVDSAGLVYHRKGSSTCGLSLTPSGTNLCYNWNDNSSAWNWDSGLTPPDGQWVYAALTISPSQAVMFMYDGKTWSAATNAVANSAAQLYYPLYVGYDNFNNGTRYFNGSIDEVAIYTRTLSPNQLRGHALAAFGDTRPPVLVTDPPVLQTKGTIYAGWPFSLAADAYGTPPLSFQWRKNGIDIPNATNTSYSVTTSAGTDSGNYDIVVTNPYGSATNTTAVAVNVVTTAPDVTSGLRTWLKFDEASGLQAHDSSGSGNNGILQGFLSDPAQWVPGLANNALSVNPDYWSEQQVVLVTNSDAFDFATNLAFTLSAWVNVNTAVQAQGVNGGIITRGYGQGGEQYSVDIDGGHFRFFVRDTNDNATVITTSAAPNGYWQHICAVYSAPYGFMRLYVNGTQVGSATPPSSLLATNHELSIGARQQYNFEGAPYDYTLDGLLDDVRVFGRALLPAEVQALYSAAPTIAPSIVQDPQGRTVYPGGSVTMTASFAGTMPMTYQWYKGSSPVAGATGTTFTLANVTSSDTGSYSVKATNGGGSTNTAGAVVTLIPLAANTYESMVVADAPEAYWRLDDTSDGAGRIIDSMGRHDGVTRSWGVADNGTGFSFAQAGALADNPDTCLQFASGNQNLVAVPYSAALNSSPFSFECWVKLASIPAANAYYAVFSSVSPVSSGQLSRGNGLYAMGTDSYSQWANWFYCVDRYNVCYGGDATLVDQWLHLVATYDGHNQYIYVNGSLSNTVPGITFYPNTTHPFHIGSGRSDWTGGSLWFDGLIDEAAYYRTALSPARINAHYTVGVYGTNSIPVFVQPPASQTVTVGETATFTAAAMGVPTITYQWKKDGLDIPGATGTSYSVPNTYYTDSGHQYSLAVTNGVGGVVSLPATLTVMPPASQTNLVLRTKAGTSGSTTVLELVWPAGVLYSAPDVTGPWQPVSGATLPYYTVSPTNTAMFFRCE